ncbi:trimeric intracellular cation channel type 1B.1-like [Artemia franciscana]|uniref:trimeric intracellular cation channel type 1B.1-like n=1 Tax=Artemia franciscana TaxID=6661 RepID=UPI0032DA05BE
MMDPESFLDVANQVTKLKMWPYFDIAHCAMCCLAVREDLGSGSHGFSRKYPLACWVSTMLVIYAGGFIAALLLGEPMLSPLKNTQSVLLATAVWYVIFYSPFDIGYKFAKFLPVKILIAALKEVYRTKKVYDGVSHAAKLFPNSWLIMIVIGVVKGNGGGFIKIAERLIRGVWTPSAIELLQPTFPTKACIAAAIVFVIDKKTDYISAPHALSILGEFASIPIRNSSYVLLSHCWLNFMCRDAMGNCVRKIFTMV